MPGLLRHPAGMLKAGRPLAGLCLSGQIVWRNPALFPEHLFDGLPFVHFAAEDAEATWTARHGLPLVMERHGSPVVADGWLDCAAGCYAAVRDPWPADTPFELWALCQPSANNNRQFYNGPQAYTNNPIAFATRISGAGVYSGNTIRTYDVPPADAPRTYSWGRSGHGYLADVVSVHVGARLVAANSTGNRVTSAAGDVFVVGGSMSQGGVPVFQGLIVRDVILTVGWTLTDAQRSALEAYAYARIAG